MLRTLIAKSSQVSQLEIVELVPSNSVSVPSLAGSDTLAHIVKVRLMSDTSPVIQAQSQTLPCQVLKRCVLLVKNIFTVIL